MFSPYHTCSISNEEERPRRRPKGRESTTTKCRTAGGNERGSVANIFRTAGPSVIYVASVANPERDEGYEEQE